MPNVAKSNFICEVRIKNPPQAGLMSAAKWEPYFVRESPSGEEPVSDGFRLRNETKREQAGAGRVVTRREVK